MKRSYLLILLISVALTVIAFVHDYLYDIPSQPYTLKQMLSEAVIIGSIYTGLVFLFLAGLFGAFKAVLSRVKVQ